MTFSPKLSKLKTKSLEDHYHKQKQFKKLCEYSYTINLSWIKDLYGLDDHLISKMEFIDEIGGGGMKSVHLVFDSHCQRKLALAKLKEEFKNPAAIERFIYEARLLANLEHPGIVPLHHLGCDSSGTPCFTMPWLKGKPLSKALQAPHTQNIDWRLNTFAKIAEAVAYAHSQGVIHLDIQPENIICDLHGEVQLIDWGVSMKIENLPQTEKESEPLSVGTPGFMSPEQERALTWKWGVHCDIYSLGKIFQYCLENISTSESLTQIYQHATQDKIEKRYARVSDMLKDIAAFRTDNIMHFEKTKWNRIFSLWVKRHKMMIRWSLATSAIIMFIIAFNQNRLSKISEREYELQQKEIIQEQIQKVVNKQHVEKLIEQANNFFLSSDRYAGIKLCQIILTYDPKSNFAMKHLAFDAISKKDYLDALDLFSRSDMEQQASLASKWIGQSNIHIKDIQQNAEALFNFKDGDFYKKIHLSAIKFTHQSGQK